MLQLLVTVLPLTGGASGESTLPARTGRTSVLPPDSKVKPALRSCLFLGPSHPCAVNREQLQLLQGDDGPEITPAQVTVTAAVTVLWVVRKERASAERTQTKLRNQTDTQLLDLPAAPGSSLASRIFSDPR